MDLALLGIPIGIVFLYFGSKWMVDGAKMIAIIMGISPFVIGLTVLAFGSSAPEAFTSIVSRDAPQLIIGNVVGRCPDGETLPNKTSAIELPAS